MMPVPTVPVTWAYQAVADVLYLSILSMPLVQAFVKLVSTMAPQSERAAEPFRPSALHQKAPLPVIGMDPAPEVVKGSSVLGLSLSPEHSTPQLVLWRFSPHPMSTRCVTTVCTGTDLACFTDVFGTGSADYIRSVDSDPILGHG